MEAETLLTLAKEVNAPGFQDRLERLEEATKANAASLRKLNTEKGKLTKRETAVAAKEERVESDRIALETLKSNTFKDLDERRAAQVKADAEAAEKLALAKATLQAAKEKETEARRIMKRALDKETKLAPTLELVEKLRA